MTVFNYSLDRQSYTWKNALCWGNFSCHCKKAMEGNLGHRVVHALISFIELIPLVSQIASIFEMLIINKFSVSSDELPNDLSNKKVSIETSNPKHQNIPKPFVKQQLQGNESLVNFKERILSELPEHIRNQQSQKTYKREKLLSLSKNNLNIPIALNRAPDGIEYFARKAIFYGYNAEGIRDYGWGCAWRAIQTCLSVYDIHVPFENLFHLFGPGNNLKFLYGNKFAGQELQSSRSFAPYDIPAGWAEPFIGQMAMHFYHIPSALENVNGIPGNCHAPEQVFHNEPLRFNAFKERLESHFKAPHAAPIMIDDGCAALNIIGIGCKGSNTTLWIADPHIKEGVNSFQSEERGAGLYTITLDESGSLINDPDEDSLIDLRFDSKRWMVLFPT